METQGPVVETRRGRVRGTVEENVCVFRGIPFAKPSVGPQRFGAPEEAWPSVRGATRFGPACPHLAVSSASMSRGGGGAAEGGGSGGRGSSKVASSARMKIFSSLLT